MIAIMHDKVFNLWYYHLYDFGEINYRTSNCFITLEECEADIPKGKGYILSSFTEITQEIVCEKVRRRQYELQLKVENNLL